jgi:hypothetical protein
MIVVVEKIKLEPQMFSFKTISEDKIKDIYKHVMRESFNKEITLKNDVINKNILAYIELIKTDTNSNIENIKNLIFLIPSKVQSNFIEVNDKATCLVIVKTELMNKINFGKAAYLFSEVFIRVLLYVFKYIIQEISAIQTKSSIISKYLYFVRYYVQKLEKMLIEKRKHKCERVTRLLTTDDKSFGYNYKLPNLESLINDTLIETACKDKIPGTMNVVARSRCKRLVKARNNLTKRGFNLKCEYNPNMDSQKTSGGKRKTRKRKSTKIIKGGNPVVILFVFVALITLSGVSFSLHDYTGGIGYLIPVIIILFFTIVICIKISQEDTRILNDKLDKGKRVEVHETAVYIKGQSEPYKLKIYKKIDKIDKDNNNDNDIIMSNSYNTSQTVYHASGHVYNIDLSGNSTAVNRIFNPAYFIVKYPYINNDSFLKLGRPPVPRP